MIRRLFVEKRPGFRQEAEALERELRVNLKLPHLEGLRLVLRYDVEGVPEAAWEAAARTVFSEPQVEEVTAEKMPWGRDEHVFAVEYLPGQFDQRADSAEQCVQLIARVRPRVVTATVHALRGPLSLEDLEKVKRFLINAVDSREASLEKPSTLAPRSTEPPMVPTLTGFREGSPFELQAWHDRLNLALSVRDLEFIQRYFREEEQRDPTLTELRVLDTYWSDHCRHTTFLTEITEVDIEDSPLTAPVRAAWEAYLAARRAVHGPRETERPVCLMDVATLGMKLLRQQGKLADLEVSEEVNAASIVVPIEVDGREEEWLVMFKNETHNHPTEIEPFGGAATCLGGAIRDPLSGRAYVYQAMRVTGAADPRVPLEATLPGKLPQRRITQEAARGYSSYGNQVGLATGLVREIYHPGYVAKRMEVGAVVGAAPRAQVRREAPAVGDVVVLVGGRTGRDGIGGATGSSKEHDQRALQNSAEVQKGDAPTERKLQRLFRHPEAARLIKRCNDFGAGGVAVAVGELAPSLRVLLDRIPRKYEGLDGTELAISESQERMAVVLDARDVAAFSRLAEAENLECTLVAEVTDSGRLRMEWRGQAIVDLAREFLDTHGVRPRARARIEAPAADSPLSARPLRDVKGAWLAALADLNACSQKGLGERFDASIGAGTILWPFGGKHQLTPPDAMAARLPVPRGETHAATLMAFGFNPEVSSWSPYHGAMCAVVEAVSRIVASGGEVQRIRLSLQEYFERLREDASRWGKPLAALLGAFEAQRALGIAAIGGKDSMSGTFKDLDVPPTLVAFAVCPVDERDIISPEFKGSGHRVVRLRVPRNPEQLPILAELPGIYREVHAAIRRQDILSARSPRFGGVAAALAEMAFGNGVGLDLSTTEGLFDLAYGDLVLELAPGAALSLPVEPLGETTDRPSVRFPGGELSLEEMKRAWVEPLEAIFPTLPPRASTEVDHPKHEGAGSARPTRTGAGAKPTVFIPVFPGTNCEYDTARAFERVGAVVETIVFRNLTESAVEESLQALRRATDACQILCLVGGFSAGDEPAGSGKFIAAALRNPQVADGIMRLLTEREGLILGICNGFQALVKTGLLPYGEIRPLGPDDPTLTHNGIGRHVSSQVRTRVTSNRSPWLANQEVGAIHTLPVSHGEGRFWANSATMAALFRGDQVATQYVDDAGQPTMEPPANPNGSVAAIEGLTSPCGRILGKMAHTERAGPRLAKNIPGLKHQPIFEAGVAYFR